MSPRGTCVGIHLARRVLPRLHAGRPRRLPTGYRQGFRANWRVGISYSPEGVSLTARDGVAAPSLGRFQRPAGATRHFRLRVNGVARTFTSTFEGNDGNGTLHGSSNFCALDDGDEDASSDEVRLDWLPDLPPARFRLENHGDARATFTFDRSLARDVAADDAIKSPDGAFGNLSVLVFPAGRTEGRAAASASSCACGSTTRDRDLRFVIST